MKSGGAKQSNDKRLTGLIQQLYKSDCWIDFETLEEIISFGERAVPCLNQIIEDALENKSNINYKNPPKDYEWFTVVHAFYLLAQLRAERSLDLVLDFLSQKEDFLDYWLHDLLNDDIWEVIYYLGQNQPGKLKEFILDQKINIFSRLAVSTALIQIGAHHPARRDEVVDIFKKVLRLEKEDPDFIGLLVSELLDIKVEALRNEILDALKRYDVWPGIISPQEVNWSYKNPKVRALTILTIFDRYEFFRQYAYFAQTSPFKPLTGKKYPKIQNHS